MLETEDFGNIAWNGACKVMQGQPEINGLFNFFCDQSEKYGIM